MTVLRISTEGALPSGLPDVFLGAWGFSTTSEARDWR
jgi:hypothetical protein